MGILRRPLGGWGEFLLVVSGAFGWFAISSVFFALHPGANSGHSTGSFWFLAVYELAMMVTLGALLRYRGWTLRSLGLTFRWTDIPLGLGLAAVAWIVYVWGSMALRYAAPDLANFAAHMHILQKGISVSSALTVVAVNPVYEEVFVAGYIVTALKDGRHTGLAINVSVAVRLLYHLYQGVAGVIGVVPLGLIFATWFAYKRRLWPLIVAHALFDAASILYYVSR